MRYQSNDQPCATVVYLVSSVLVAFIAATALASAKSNTTDIPTTILSDGSNFPLVGLGVGNLQHDAITSQIENAIKDDKKFLLFDTASASKNENLVREGIKNAVRKKPKFVNKKTDIHVVTKVWYTHLGYERTKLSVKESLEELKHPNIRVHILIHWPRCNDAIPWMNCEQEENDLPDTIKKAGPPPHLHNDTAFLESWKALEDIYLEKIKLGRGLPKVASIGISNFNLDDMKALEQNQRVSPMIYQGNVWSYLFDPFLMSYLNDNKIHFQAYNVINGAFHGSADQGTPNAVSALEDISRDLLERSGSSQGEYYTRPQIVLKWLVQNKVSVIPRTSRVERLEENSPMIIAEMPDLQESEMNVVRDAVSALLKREDLEAPLAHFVNKSTGRALNLFWVHIETGEEIPVKGNLSPGETYTAFTEKGHKFAVYTAETNIRQEFIVSATHGQQEHFDILDQAEGEL